MLRFLMRGAIYIVFAVVVVVGWLMKRRAKPTSTPNDHSNEAIENPLEALHHPNWQMRVRAIALLSQNTDSDTLMQLMPMLRDSDSDVRDAAVEAISHFGEATIQPLQRLLSEGWLDTREAVVRTLALIGGAAAVPPLVQALDDESAWVRVPAARALGQIGSTAAVPALVQHLSDPHEDVQAAVRHALKQIATPEALAALHPPSENGYHK
ncbi:MAG: HEAT repeat domain-containing protein [Anaerolineae bacterium]|nr:HEAT repeat domain-containing protein [Anaerolineae bacterium]